MFSVGRVGFVGQQYNSSVWYLSPAYAAIAQDGSIVYPTWIMDGINQRYAKGAIGSAVSQVSFSGLLETFTRASTATYFDATGALQTAAINVPRTNTYDPATLQPLGFSVEEARTNSIRNSKMLGGDLAGNILPTNVSFGTYTGFTISGRFAGYGNIPGTTGAKYIDIKLTCVASGAVASMVFDTSQAIPAVQNEIFAAGVYVQLIAGSYTNLTTEFNVVSRNAAGGFIANESTTLFTATSTVSRAESVATLTAATTAYASHGLVVRSTGAGDITLRIWIPQQEKLTAITQKLSSPILTDGSSVTRAQDEPYTTDMSFFNQNEGSMFVLSYTGDGTPFGFGNSVGNDRGQILDTVSDNGFFGVDNAGNSTEPKTTTGLTYGAKKCTGITYGTNYTAAFANGVKLADDTTTWSVWAPSRISIGRRYAATPLYGNKPIGIVIVYAKRLTDVESVRITNMLLQM